MKQHPAEKWRPISQGIDAVIDLSGFYGASNRGADASLATLVRRIWKNIA